jgi:hypothetical protein
MNFLLCGVVIVGCYKGDWKWCWGYCVVLARMDELCGALLAGTQNLKISLKTQCRGD